MNRLSDLIAKNRAGIPVAIPSVCSAHPDVLVAALLLARECRWPILIEATSNQCNQFGGYTGLSPADFIAFVHALANEHEVELSHTTFGGDHLGPHVWKTEKPDSAMTKAHSLMRVYVEAGFTKIHLDCSEGCAGEPAKVDDIVNAERASALAGTCERYAPDTSKLCYVIGTEVPTPGGADAAETNETITPTLERNAVHTLEIHKSAFRDAGLDTAWSRVIAVVVQPGIDFSPMHVHHFQPCEPYTLSAALRNFPTICFEAHSTDYQHESVFYELARRHFAILKVGPALTFAYRQAVYALDHLRSWLLSGHDRPQLAETMERLMRQHPSHWQAHYPQNSDRLALHFGYSDRIRYYWPEETAQIAVGQLMEDLATCIPATPLLEQYFTPQIIDSAKMLESGGIGWPRSLILAQIQAALKPYFFGAHQ